MNRFVKGLLTALAIGVARKYRQSSLDFLKIKAATAYLHGVQGAHRAIVAGILLLALLLLAAAGFVMIHVGLFLGLVSHPVLRATLFVVLGLAYMIVAVVFIRKRCSEEYWMAVTGADRLVEDVTRDHPR
ncbi:MAG: hypothetical protein HY343_04180 [Lentisphaerae bacterium]|nr:hypothetical protein [Lentisphaerota bacterium]